MVGRLLTVERHPNADKLWLTSVDVGGDEPLQIVCGADNISSGDLVPVALVGSVLPGDRRIERSKIRGVESQGMLCSAIELGLGDDAEGIHLLGGAGDALPLGSDLRPLVGEVVLDVDVKPNRGDALVDGRPGARGRGHHRRGAAPAGRIGQEDAGCRPPSGVSVEIQDPDGCPRFTARWFEGVSNGSSPAWMQRRLLAAGMRPISAVVDVTNYVMHELGQPMHAYDADTVPGGRIVVRRARAGEPLETIDHEQRSLDERMLVIADAERAIGLAGIMGGAGTEVTEATPASSSSRPSSMARPSATRRAGWACGPRRACATRRGSGTICPAYAADRAARLIAEITGARVAEGIVDNDPGAATAAVIAVELGAHGATAGISLDGRPGR